MTRLLAAVHVGLVLLVPTMPASAAPAPLVPANQEQLAGLVESIDASSIGPDADVAVYDLRIDAGLGSLHLRGGTLFVATPTTSAVVEVVFLGDAVLEIDAPDDIEAGQLELFTGHRNLDERIDRAVLVVPRDAIAAALSDPGGEPADGPERLATARALLAAWRAGPERKLLGVRAAMLLDAAGEPARERFFAGRLHSERLGDFLLLVDPDAEEQVTLGQFVPLLGSAKEQRERERYIHKQQRKGRLIGLDLGDLGRWNTWLSSRLVDDTGAPRGGAAAFEPEHYELDVSVGERHREVAGNVRVDLRAVAGGRRVVELEMHSDLQLEAARMHDGDAVPLFTEQGVAPELVSRAYVFLPRAAARGERLSLELDFRGLMLDRVRNRVFRLRETIGWYPHVGTIDRATYRATLWWPAKLNLVASGRLLASGRDGKERRWQTRALELPSTAFSFELGDFRFRELTAGHVTVTVAFDGIAADAPRRNQQQVLRTIKDSLLFYETKFGRYPLDYLTVVTAPRDFSQGLLGFVSLATGLLYDYRHAYWFGIEDRRTVIAHEIAHQWWGNLVGWRSYRDEWISEAMANYSAMVWARNRLPRGRRPRVGPADQWQASLSYSAEDGRPVESLGPLVLGRRLNSSRSLEAYESIVYKKGAVVLNMLNYVFGETRFLTILRAMIHDVRNTRIATEDFLSSIETKSGVDLEWFAKQYVYGTGLPEVYYSYEFRPKKDGRWVIAGEVRQQTPYTYTYRVVRMADGGFDVRRDAASRVDVSQSSLVVPVQIAVHNPRAKRKGGVRAESERPANSTIAGRLLQRGERYEFEVEIDYEPKEFWLDPHEMVFGRFFSEHRSPKRVLMYRGFDAAAAGDAAAAVDYLVQALAAEVAEEPPATHTVDAFLYEWEERYLDASIHTNLAWLYLDEGRLEDAREEIRLARRVPHSFTRARIAGRLNILESRLEILQGEYEKAWRRLRKDLLRGTQIARTDGYLLLAIAAQATGNVEDFEAAASIARKRGADLSVLDDPRNR